MRIVKPEVHLIARPYVVLSGLDDALSDHAGHEEWLDKRFFGSYREKGSEAENLVEAMGRLCYDSFGVGGNPNVTRVREDSGEYFENLIRSGHGSVLEHAQFSFHFKNVSRVFTHELVRHRVGTAISQESGRYVRPTELRVVYDPLFTEQDSKDFEKIEAQYLARVDDYDWDNLPFSQKKQITSMLRKKLPESSATEMGWSANIRALRHIIEMRTSEHAEWEIRYVFDKVADIMYSESIKLFADLVSHRGEKGPL